MNGDSAGSSSNIALKFSAMNGIAFRKELCSTTASSAILRGRCAAQSRSHKDRDNDSPTSRSADGTAAIRRGLGFPDDCACMDPVPFWLLYLLDQILAKFSP